MNDEELQTLAILIGGKVFKGQILMPQQAVDAPGRGICAQCCLLDETFDTCMKFTDRDNGAADCSATNVVWQPIVLPLT